MTLESGTIGKIVAAMLAARAEFDPVLKDATNPAFRSKYSTLLSVQNATDPALAKHRILPIQQTDIVDGKIVLVTRMIHDSGEWLGSRYPVNPSKNDPQGEGSALTYARRYALLALFGIAPEDDDDNAAAKRTARAATVSDPNPDPTGETTQGYEAAIAMATTLDELGKVGSEIATAAVSSTQKAALRADFTKRMKELKP